MVDASKQHEEESKQGSGGTPLMPSSKQVWSDLIQNNTKLRSQLEEQNGAASKNTDQIIDQIAEEFSKGIGAGMASRQILGLFQDYSAGATPGGPEDEQE